MKAKMYTLIALVVIVVVLAIYFIMPKKFSTTSETLGYFNLENKENYWAEKYPLAVEAIKNELIKQSENPAHFLIKFEKDATEFYSSNSFVFTLKDNTGKDRTAVYNADLKAVKFLATNNGNNKVNSYTIKLVNNVDTRLLDAEGSSLLRQIVENKAFSRDVVNVSDSYERDKSDIDNLVHAIVMTDYGKFIIVEQSDKRLWLKRGRAYFFYPYKDFNGKVEERVDQVILDDFDFSAHLIDG